MFTPNLTTPRPGSFQDGQVLIPPWIKTLSHANTLWQRKQVTLVPSESLLDREIQYSPPITESPVGIFNASLVTKLCRLPFRFLVLLISLF